MLQSDSVQPSLKCFLVGEAMMSSPSALTDILFSVDLDEDLRSSLDSRSWTQLGVMRFLIGILEWDLSVGSFGIIHSLISGSYQRVLRVFSVTIWLPRKFRMSGTSTVSVPAIPIIVIQIVSTLIPFFLYEQHSHFIFLFQGFDGVALTPGKATMVIHNYEVRTGHLVSMTELESGYLKGWLRPEDYDIKQQVSWFEQCNPPMGLLLRGPLWEGSLAQIPREGSRPIRSYSFSHFSVQGVDGSPSPWPTSSSHCAFTRRVSFNGGNQSFNN